MRKITPMPKVFYDRLRNQLQACIEHRRSTAYVRSFQGEPEEAIFICLGPGRCLCPSQSGPKFCAFCKHYPSARGSDAEFETVVSCMRSGH